MNIQKHGYLHRNNAGRVFVPFCDHFGDRRDICFVFVTLSHVNYTENVAIFTTPPPTGERSIEMSCLFVC